MTILFCDNSSFFVSIDIFSLNILLYGEGVQNGTFLYFIVTSGLHNVPAVWIQTLIFFKVN